MLPIAPLDYERNMVALNPLLVQEVVQEAIGARIRNAEPVGPSSAQLYRHDTPPQDLLKQAGSDEGFEKTENLRLDKQRSISSSLSVELSSIAGITPEFLNSAKESAEISSRVVTEHYEPSGENFATKVNISA